MGRRTGRTVLSATVLSATVLAACGSGRGPTTASPRTVSPTTTASSTTASSTTASSTTVFAPADPQSSPDRAAARLVAAWAGGNQAEAASVASPLAVATLFSTPYPAGALQARGCTDPTANPGSCTYRNTSTDGIYEITVVDGASGWYVSAVIPET
ncbi:MAG: hypothetical protein JO337_06110 [Acidimicrobiales bacterium]|nr:hypothetical protein [Acidimicrobiales bacterium]